MNLKNQTAKDVSVPRHIGIIMDGNGRWAQKRGLPRTAGHQVGLQATRQAVETCVELGIQVLTLYVFSTENWQRPREEVNFLMSLAEGYAARDLPEFLRMGIRLQLMGNREGLPASLLNILDKAILQTDDNTGMVLNLALNYGGRAEIVDAIKAILAAHKHGTLDASHLDEETFARYLYCPDCPNADLIIRTGAEWRLSNFLLWHASEAIFWSTSVLWPDFQREHLQEAIQIYVKQTIGWEIGS
jgi:undecaprenyl diphosphate synthase